MTSHWHFSPVLFLQRMLLMIPKHFPTTSSRVCPLCSSTCASQRLKSSHVKRGWDCWLKGHTRLVLFIRSFSMSTIESTPFLNNWNKNDFFFLMLASIVGSNRYWSFDRYICSTNKQTKKECQKCSQKSIFFFLKPRIEFM